MRILLTNDDGIQAPGIRILAERLGKIHEVFVSAPRVQMSSCSHRVTYFRHDLDVQEEEVPGAVQAWSVDGTPADCVYAACYGLLETRPDLVISGINQGQNISMDAHYSGTVAAAREGLIIGIPSMAVSLASNRYGDFGPSAEITERLLEKYLQDHCCAEYLLNVNVPAVPADQIAGLRITHFEMPYGYDHDMVRLGEADGHFVLHTVSGRLRTENAQADPDGDLTAVRYNYVSLTPLGLDQVTHDHEDRLREKNVFAAERRYAE